MVEGQYRLVVRQGPNPGQIYELTRDEISIGRDISNDIVVGDAEVSRKHAQLTLEAGRYKIEDLNSTNGTYIDGQRLIGPHVLAIGEIIMFGDNVGMVFDGEPPKADVTVPSTIDLGSTPVAAIPSPAESYIPPAAPPAALMEGLSGEEEPSAEEQAEQVSETGRKPVNSWLLAGLGCVIVVIILLIALWVFIDQPWDPGGGLYCVSPFDILFRSLEFCP